VARCRRSYHPAGAGGPGEGSLLKRLNTSSVLRPVSGGNSNSVGGTRRIGDLEVIHMSLERRPVSRRAVCATGSGPCYLLWFGRRPRENAFRSARTRTIRALSLGERVSVSRRTGEGSFGRNNPPLGPFSPSADGSALPRRHSRTRTKSAVSDLSSSGSALRCGSSQAGDPGVECPHPMLIRYGGLTGHRAFPTQNAEHKKKATSASFEFFWDHRILLNEIVPVQRVAKRHAALGAAVHFLKIVGIKVDAGFPK